MAASAESPPETPTAEDIPTRFAWQPLTPRGVAAFSTATFDRALFVLILFGLLVSGVCVWFAKTRFSPAITQFVEALPETGAVTNGTLTGFPAPVVSDHRFLSLLANPDLDEVINRTADIQVEFYSKEGQIGGLAGFLSHEYPADWTFEFSRSKAAPWWGAWEPIVLGILAVALFIVFYLIWMLLPTFYFLVIRTFGYFADRSLTVGGAWRMAAVSSAPGAVCLAGGLLAYAWQWVDLIKLGLIASGYLVFFILYPLLAIRHLDPLPEAGKMKGNPFKH